MKDKSFLRHLRNMVRVLMCLVTLSVAVFLWAAYNSAADRQQSEIETYLAVFGTQMDGRIDKTNEVLAEFVYDNSVLNLLRSEDEAERLYSAQAVFREMNHTVQNINGADVLVVAQSGTDVCITAFRPGVSLSTREELNSFTKEYAENGIVTGGWECLHGSTGTYIYRALHSRGRAVIAFIRAETLLAEIPEQFATERDYYLTDADGALLCSSGNTEILSGGRLPERNIAGGILKLCCQSRPVEVFRQIGSTVILLLVLLVLLLLFSLVFSSTLRRELLVPMAKLTDDMKNLESGSYDVQFSTSSDSIEFRSLVSSFNKLISEILRLKISNYEQRLAFMDAEEKYIRLQLRPHFFLNAMTTIVGLSRSGENEQIETYIDALSKIVRYMFSSGLHTVPAADELRHVENYIKMQELKYPGSILYFIDASEEAKHWQIPQMLIHTIVENEYKYAVSAGSQLMVLIKLYITQEAGEGMLCIEIEDDGDGYPESIIGSINDPDYVREDDGSHVGLWSIRRLLQLMYGKPGLFRLSNVEPHGAMSRILVPAEPIRQRRNSVTLEKEGGTALADTAGR